MTATLPETFEWRVDYIPAVKSAGEAARYGVTRILQVGVRAPYDAKAISVLRKDGSIAFDGYNHFASQPALLLKGVVYDAIKKNGRFQAVVSPSSTVRSEYSVEVVFQKLTLDCREAEKRLAVAEVEIRMVKASDRSIAAILEGAGKTEAADGDYSKAFSSAVSQALDNALGKLK